MRANSGGMPKKTAAQPSKPARKSPAKGEGENSSGLIDPNAVFSGPGATARAGIPA